MVWIRPSRSRPRCPRPDQGRGAEGNSGGSAGSSLAADGGAGSGGDGGTRGEGRTQQRPPSRCATAVTNAPNQKLVVIYALRLPSAPVFCIWLLGDSEEKKILSLSVTISSAVSRHRKLAQFRCRLTSAFNWASQMTRTFQPLSDNLPAIRVSLS